MSARSLLSVRNLLLAALAAPLLAACVSMDGGGGFETPSDIAYRALWDETARLRAAYPASQPVTGSGALNAQGGTARYEGTAVLRVPTAQTTSLLGDARVNVDFGSRVVAGRLDGFQGIVNGAAHAVPMSGRIDLAGDFNSTRPRDITLATSGRLVGGASTIDVTGITRGDFLDGAGWWDPARAIRADLGAGSTISMSTNGGPILNYAPGGTNSGLSILVER